MPGTHEEAGEPGGLLPPGPGVKRLVMEALRSAPEGLTVPEAVTLPGLAGRRQAVHAALLDGLREGWAVRDGCRRGARNVPMVIYRSSAGR